MACECWVCCWRDDVYITLSINNNYHLINHRSTSTINQPTSSSTPTNGGDVIVVENVNWRESRRCGWRRWLGAGGGDTANEPAGAWWRLALGGGEMCWRRRTDRHTGIAGTRVPVQSRLTKRDISFTKTETSCLRDVHILVIILRSRNVATLASLLLWGKSVAFSTSPRHHRLILESSTYWCGSP